MGVFKEIQGKLDRDEVLSTEEAEAIRTQAINESLRTQAINESLKHYGSPPLCPICRQPHRGRCAKREAIHKMARGIIPKIKEGGRDAIYLF